MLYSVSVYYFILKIKGFAQVVAIEASCEGVISYKFHGQKSF